MRWIASVRSASRNRSIRWPRPVSAASTSVTASGRKSLVWMLCRQPVPTMFANSASFDWKCAYSVAFDTPPARAIASMLTAP